ncbi:unnamed protein product [Linum tenue]|uniref:Uncharacterized protein n=1 Tax=Linum tenue TaxID=586396 RepID=A0AAV0NAC3_9ROSI|nr:unnamed protein product [Linum tenue]CAI0455536.1 unnamed protein product [Linum tenue]
MFLKDLWQYMLERVAKGRDLSFQYPS